MWEKSNFQSFLLPELPPDPCSKPANPSLKSELIYIFKSQGLDTKEFMRRKKKIAIEPDETKMAMNPASNRS